MSSSPYDEAGNLLNKILTQHISLKTASFGKDSKSCCSKSAYALVSNTLLYKASIDTILNHDEGQLKKLIQWESIHNTALIYILLYELLYGKYHSIRGGGYLRRKIMQHASLFQSTKDQLTDSKNTKVTTGATGLHDIPNLVRFPRYVRINTLRVSSTDDIVTTLKQQLQAVQSDPRNTCIYADQHVPNLLVLSPDCSLNWTQHHLITSGKVVLQDKSSCLSALALAHGRPLLHAHHTWGDFIDACAAPGNKTTHLAALLTQRHETALMHGESLGHCRIFAFDRSSSRLHILQERIAQIQAEETCSTRVVEIIPKLQDFLQVDPKDPMYVNVKGILLDPSCSGSGIINTPDRIMDEAYETCQKRIKALASFQLLALKHAMSFPQVRHIVYSTCSIQEEENEEVVGRALDEVNREIQEEGMTWVLVLPHALRRWKRRGKSIVGIITEEQAQALIRVDGADGDETNGFFVCYLERRFLTLEKSCEDDCPLALPTVVRGWYDGQFSIDRVEDDQNNGDSCRNHLQCDASIKDDDANKSSDKSVRKRQKKIEWKRKQKLQRLKRLKSQCV